MKLVTALKEASSRKATRTENGMPTHTSSTNYCLDLFGTIGSARGWDEDKILTAFTRALGENPLLAMKILFWARDVRMGAGERRVFRVCLDYLNKYHQGYLYKNIHLVPEYGRWDDLFGIDNKYIIEIIVAGLRNRNGLLAKWLPRKGDGKGSSTSVFINRLRKALGLGPKDYRRLLVDLSNTVEQDMCSNNWGKIEYQHVPSQAMLKYRKAFPRHDAERFQTYLDAVKAGGAKINAGAVYPYQLFKAVASANTQASLQAVEAQWAALPNFLEGSAEKVLPICDVSGSMYDNNFGGVIPMDVSVSLGIYISERNEGPFKNAFMTFSGSPTIQYLTGNLFTRCQQLLKAHWSMNTNLEAVFKLLLNSAVEKKVSAEDMPTMLLIISDMQFDRCVKSPKASASDMIRKMYKKAGYEVPKLVFWNVNARIDQTPVMANESKTAIISGCSPAILKSILSGDVFNPVQTMLNVINSDRYAAITV